MGVQGLTGLLQQRGLHNDDNNPTTTTNLIPGSTTLAIDGNGLLFHLFRMAYHRHCQSVRSSNNPHNNKSLQSQLLLPSLVPLTLIDDVTSTYLSQLTVIHGMHLRIYFDGSKQQYMKRLEHQSRREQRMDEWENVRQLCLFGILPEKSNGSGEPSKFRSGARRQAREHQRSIMSTTNATHNSNANENTKGAETTTNAEDYLYLTSFPLSPLILNQIERSIMAFAEMNAALPCGSLHIIQCDGEADVEVAKASAQDGSGRTFSVGNDSDYYIYGWRRNDIDDDDTNTIDYIGRRNVGETLYIPFHQLDPSSGALRVKAYTPSHISEMLGLPNARAMIELAILFGNDYTGPYLKGDNGKKRKVYRESLRWFFPNEGSNGDGDGDDDGANNFSKERLEKELEEGGEKLPPEGELNWYDTEGLVDHIAEKVAEGKRLCSTNTELQMAIQFSYNLYSFGDVSDFPTVAPVEILDEDAENDDSDAEEEDEMDDVFPSLPRDLDISIARDAVKDMDLCDAALLPIATYLSQICVESSANHGASNDTFYVEQRHLDAFRMTLQLMKPPNNPQEIEPPRHPLKWKDMQALYILEKCLLEAIIGNSAADALTNMPHRIFQHATFHSCLEALSFEDDPLENEVVNKKEKAFLEDVTNGMMSSHGEEKEEEEESKTKKLVLPIDEHKEEILTTVRMQRVTIIHGETGCGKSSRVPCFLLRADPPEPTRTAPQVKMIISQPRRIAAKALAERVRSCEPDLRDKIGLRMGHGIREHETGKTRAWFVTTGYVVRLLANHPSWFDSHTHLIIDEVHERSVDTDILCLLCRRLLQSHPTIRLVLMSATMAAELYKQYFGTPQPPIHVGARRFPIKEIFVEDLKLAVSLSSKSAKIAKDVYNNCEKTKCTSAPSGATMEKLYHLAAQITASVGGNGSSVLIFVPGMSDIEAIIELVEKLHVNDTSFICLPIHSDVPFEEQMAAFEPPKEGEVKVIIATNAAESSLTLPDVDHVICLGLCKQIVYNRASHRQMLVPTWISKASATQRAGRTGRVREGNVYRLYSRNTFHKYMQPFDQGELVRTPLDSTILNLREMLNEAVTPILLDCLEPPDISTIERSFESLHASNFISDPTDEGEITSLGSLVVALGIDLTLGAFVGLGIQFGVAAEAIQLAAILSFPKTPWAMSSPLYHDTDTFNEIVSKTFVSRCIFDAGLFSEPLAMSNLLHDYSNCRDRNQFCWKNRLSVLRMRHLSGTVESLKRRVAECLNVRSDMLEMRDPPRSMAHAKTSILRILQVWLFYDTMIVHNPSKRKVESVNGALSIELDGPPIRRDHLLQILDAGRHPFEMKSRGKFIQQGHFESENLLPEYFQSLEIRFVSYLLEKNVDLSFLFVGSSLKIIIPADIWEMPESTIRDSIIGKIGVSIKEITYLQSSGGGNQRGRRGRACGAWHPPSNHNVLASSGALPMRRVFVLYSKLSKSQAKKFMRHVNQEITNKIDSISSILSCTVTQSKQKVLFAIASLGEYHDVSNTDLCDLFAAPDLMSYPSTSTMKQSVSFPLSETYFSEDGASNSHPLIEDSPEGARLLSVLASERRRDNFIRFSDGCDEYNYDESKFIDVNISKAFSINGNRWKRKDGGGMVFVPENCVPVAAIPTNNSQELFCCCANTLDLRGGACRVDGITMLPPGRLFVGLALLCFGIHPKTGLPVNNLDINEYVGEEKKDAGEMDCLKEALFWIYEKGNVPFFLQEEERVVQALDFHMECMELGETLECQPDKIAALCKIFDGVNGQAMAAWDGYDVSLKAALPLYRPSLHINSSVNLDQEGHSESNADDSMTNDDDGTRQANLTTKSDMKSITSTQKLTQTTFACLGCNAIFTKWNRLRRHREKCCPGTQFGRKKSTDLANELKANDSPSDGNKEKNNKSSKTSLPEVPNKNAKARTKAKSSTGAKSGGLALESVCTAGSIVQDSHEEQAHPPATSTPKNKSSSRPKLACVKCNKLFRRWKSLTKHREQCCPGIQFSRKQSSALAIELEVSNLCTTSPSESKRSNGEAKAQQADKKKNEGLAPKQMWVCQSCNEMFGKKKECGNHIKKCSFGLVKNTKPIMKHVCARCNKMFDTPKKCRSHVKGCQIDVIMADAVQKEA